MTRRSPPGFFGGGAPREVAPRTFFVPAFANSAALATSDGLVVFDCGVPQAGDGIRHALRSLVGDPVHTVVFSHGHVDHAFGIDAFDEEAARAGRPRPRRVAHERVVERFRRYARTRGLNEHVNRVQFGLDDVTWPERFPWPDVTFSDRMTLVVGGERFELRHAMGETDDAVWLWAPERAVVCAGDLWIGVSPNCGNPQKVQRYPEGWAEALETIASLEPEVLLPGHGDPIVGAAAIARALGDTARWLRSLVEQTIERLNRGERHEHIATSVKPPADLADRPYLQPLYDRPEFVVRNVIRQHAGWWDGNPANLLPAPEAARAREIAFLAGGTGRLCERARAVADSDLPLACHLAEWAALAAPDDAEAQRTKRDLFRRRADAEPSLMGRGIFEHAAREADRALRRLAGDPPST